MGLVFQPAGSLRLLSTGLPPLFLSDQAVSIDTLDRYALYYLRVLLSGIWISALDTTVFIKLGMDKKGPRFGKVYLECVRSFYL